MFELVGTLDRVQVDFTLWIVVAAPWLALGLALRASVLGDVARAPAVRLARQAGLIALALALATTLYGLGTLIWAESQPQLLLCNLWTLARIGSIDIEATLVLDLVAGLSLVAVCLAALGFVSLDPERESMRRLGSVLAATGGLNLALLSDDIVVVIIGLVAAQGALAVLVAGKRLTVELPGGGFIAARVAELSALLAVGVVSWSLAGSWTDSGDFIVDFSPRLVGVQDPSALEQAPATKTRVRSSTGALEMTSLPGARLVVGTAVVCQTDADGRSGGIGLMGRPCRKEARAPFAQLEFPAALHDFTVETGPGSYDFRVEKVRVHPGARTVLMATGPTLSLKNAAAQMALRDGDGAYVHRAGFSSRRVLGSYATSIISGLLLLSLLGFVVARRRDDSGPGSLAAMISAAPALPIALLLHRMGYVFALNERMAAWIVLAAALLTVVVGLRAAFARTTRAAVVDLAYAALCVSLAGIATGEGARAMVYVVATYVGLAALLVSLRGWSVGDASPALERRAVYAAAAVATGAPLPLLGVFFGRDALLRGVASLQGAAVPAWVLAGLVTAGLALASFAVWRLAFAACTKAKAGDDAARSATWAYGLAGLVALVGLVASAGPLVGQSAEFLQRWLRAPVVEAATTRLGGDVQLVWSLAGFAAVVLGFVLAMRRYSKDDFEARESERPLHGFFSVEPNDEQSKWTPALALAADSIARLEDAVFAIPALEAQPAVATSSSAPDPDQGESAAEDEPAGKADAEGSASEPASKTSSKVVPDKRARKKRKKKKS
ncbi:MAG: hypothetical protein R3B13_32880 [Polyangiaceae bacterium]